jgi:hypothetical protein
VYQENVVNLQNKKVVVQHSYKTYFALMVKNLTKGLKPIDEMSDIWSALTHEERVYLRENTKYQEFKKNEMIYCEGEVPEFLYCVIVGKIKIFKNHDFVRLEEKVNLFIRDVTVVSTQLTIIPPTEESYTQYVVLVTYEG